MEKTDPQILLSDLANNHLYLEALQKLKTLISTDAQLIYPHLKDLMKQLQSNLTNHENGISTKTTEFLTFLITTLKNPDSEQFFKINLLNQVIINLGHQTQSSLRQASHILCLQFTSTYKNFDGILFHYLEVGLNQQTDHQIQQKVINSFQSILLLESRQINWKSQLLQKITQILVSKVKHNNKLISKASSQAVLSILKAKNSNKLLLTLPQQILEQLKNLITQNTIFQQPGIRQKIDLLIQQKNNPQQWIQQEAQTQLKLENLQQLSMPQLFITILNKSNIITLRLNAYNVVSQKYMKHSSDQLISTIKQNKLKISRLLKQQSIKIISIGVRFIQILYDIVNPQNEQLLQLMQSLLSTLSDYKPSVRMLISQTIKIFIQKGHKEKWIQIMLQQLYLSNEYQKQEIILLLIGIFKDRSNLPNIKLEETLISLSKYVEDGKTRIKLKTFECLIEICLAYNKVKQGSNILQKQLNSVYYEIFLERLNKTQKQISNANVNNKFNGLKDIQQFKLPIRKHSFMIKKTQNNTHTLPLRRTFDIKSKSILSQRETIQDQRKSIESLRNRITQSYKSKNKVLEFEGRLSNFSRQSKVRSYDVSMRTSQSHGMRSSRSRLNVSTAQDFKSDNYLLRQNLFPFENPGKIFKQIIMALQDSDWKKSFQATNNLRRIIQHHPQIITLSQTQVLKIVIQGLLKSVQSQRSTQAKNGLLCLTQLFEKIPKIFDSSVEIIIDKLTKKSADANLFMNFQVKKCLNAFATNISSHKIVNQIDSLKVCKSTPIKDSLLDMLKSIVNKDCNIKELDKITDILIFFLDQGLNDLRFKAKQCLNDICSKVPGYEQKLKSIMNQNKFQRFISIKKQLSSNTTSQNTFNTNLPLLKNKTSKRNFKQTSNAPQNPQNVTKQQQQKQIIFQQRKLKRKVTKVTNFSSEFSQLQLFLSDCKHSDWNKRIESLKKVYQFAISFQEEFPYHRLNSQFVDILTSQIAQHNNKVNLNALTILKSLISPLRILIQNNLSLICNSVFNTLGTNKVQHRTIAQQIFELMISQIDISLLLQHWCYGCLFSLPKSRQYLLNLLIKSIRKINESHKLLITKHIIPTVDRLLVDKKPQIIFYTKQFVKHLNLIIGQQLSNHSTKKVQLNKYLQSS